MLSQNDFLGGLGNLEGSFLIGIVSIVYSLAIAVIPFIAKRIVSGDVGSTAVAMVGTAVTALTAGAAGFEGAAAGVAASRAGSTGASSAAGIRRRRNCGISTRTLGRREREQARTTATDSHRCLIEQRFLTGRRQPDIRGPCGPDSQLDQRCNGHGRSQRGEQWGNLCSGAGVSGFRRFSPVVRAQRQGALPDRRPRTRRGPSVHRYNLGTWTAYHAARIAAGSIAGATRRAADQD